MKTEVVKCDGCGVTREREIASARTVIFNQIESEQLPDMLKPKLRFYAVDIEEPELIGIPGHPAFTQEHFCHPCYQKMKALLAASR